MTDQQQQQEQQAKIVEDILSAPTLYDVLNVRPDDLSNLRKSYLTTSVKVHPDKNQHPQATQAFQRVAEAWGTLSDDSARADYDAELRGGGGGGGGGGNNTYSQRRSNNNNSTHYAYDFDRSEMPSFQEAMFMFATVTAMFSGSGGAGAAGGAAATASRSGSAVNAASDFVETLFWAKQLAENRQQQQQQQQYNNQNDEYHQNRSTAAGEGAGGGSAASAAAETATNDPLRSGMALGSGLRAFANAQRAMGFTKSAMATDKAATTMQVAAVGAAALKAANENPAVKRTLERGSTTLKSNPQLAKGIRASISFAGSLLSTLQEAQAQQEKQSTDQQQQQQQAGPSTRRV